jgi:O-antigen ligase
MVEFGSAGAFAAESGRTPFKGVVLAGLMTLLLGGGLPLCFLLFGSLAWLFWVITLFILFLFSMELPLGRLLGPLVPYLAWLCFYLIWGLIIAPDNDWNFVLKTLATTLIIAASMAVLTSRPQYLRTFATAAQFAVLGNLLVLFFMARNPGFARLVDSVSLDAGQFELGVSRFGGLWGNPNMAGYVCVVTTVLSALASRWIGWIGRLACLPLIYLTASRKALILFLLVCLIYLVVVQRRNFKFWLLSVTGAIILAIAFALSSGLQDSSRAAASDPHIARLMDLQEKATAQGGDTRVGLLKDWLAKVGAEPWHGYGLQAMAGNRLDPVNPDNILRYGVFPVGTHNTYLGIWIDIGPIGLAVFLLMMGYYAKLTLSSQGPPIARWVLMSLLMCNLVILVVSHTHLFSFEGKCAFLLFFLLPSCRGLRELSLRPASAS